MIDFDEFRAAYPTATLEEVRAFHTRIWTEFPDQSHFSAEPMYDAIEEVKPTTVVELGGWDGEAARKMLDEFPSIEMWTNYEVCAEVVLLEPTHDRYAACCTEWFWSYPRHADMLVASHVIEHLTLDHLTKLLDAAKVRAVYLEAPLHDHPIGWWGSPTTHVLEVGWTTVYEMLEERGWRTRWTRNLALPEKSGGFSRASLHVAGQG